MTTTSTQSGLGLDEKPASRVLRPPGGESSDIFGVGQSYTMPAQKAQPAQSAVSNDSKSRLFGNVEPSPPSKANRGDTHSNIFGESPDAAPSRTKGRGQSAYNPITGEPYEVSPKAPAQEKSEQQSSQEGQGDTQFQAGPGKCLDVHTSSRVLNPPGGKATKLW